MPKKEDVKLRGIFTGDFRCNELTLCQDAERRHGKLRKGEVYMFVSHKGDQILWVWKTKTVKRIPKGHAKLKYKTAEIVDSRRLRLTRGEWSPLMIQNYSKEVGLWLHGLSSLEVRFEARS